MADKRLPMRKIREVLRPRHICRFGGREIAQSLRIVQVRGEQARAVTSRVITGMSPIFQLPALC